MQMCRKFWRLIPRSRTAGSWVTAGPGPATHEFTACDAAEVVGAWPSPAMTRMSILPRVVIILALALLGLPLAAHAQTGPACVPEHAPARPGLDPALWLNTDGSIYWPAQEGFYGRPAQVDLAPGTLLDRFGDQCGRFVSPKGEAYSARALPYACMAQSYTVYRVQTTLHVTAGKAEGWFDEPGGAEQYETPQPIYLLLQQGVLVEELHDSPNAGGADRPCDAR